MQSQSTSLLTFVSSASCFIIPPFQRAYQWNLEKVHNFVSDIWFAHPQDDKSYWIGPNIVRSLSPNESGVCERYKASGSRHRCHEIIDGQQRLTTLYLFVVALNHHSKEFGDGSTPAPDAISLQKANQVELDKLLQSESGSINDFRQTSDLISAYRYLRFLLWLGPAAFESEAVVQDGFRSQDTESVVKQWEAALQNEDLQLPEKAELGQTRTDDLERFITNSVEMSTFYLEPKMDEVRVFTVLNGNRQSLGEFDFVRNYVFATLPDGDRSIRDQLFERVWSPSEAKFEILGKKNANRYQNEFVYEYLASIGEGSNKGFNKNRSFTFFKNYIESNRSIESSAFEWAEKNFENEVFLWWFQKHNHWEGQLPDETPIELSNSARRSLRRIHHVSDGPPSPFVIWLLRQHLFTPDPACFVDSEEVELVLRKLEGYLYAEKLVGKSHTNLRAKLLKDLGTFNDSMKTKDGTTTAQKLCNYLDDLLTVKKSRDLRKLIATGEGEPDSMAYNALKYRGMIGLFDAFLDATTDGEQELITRHDRYLNSRFSIEHIAPQVLEKKSSKDPNIQLWRSAISEAEGASWKKTQMRIHALGNLTAIPDELQSQLRTKVHSAKSAIVSSSDRAMTYRGLHSWRDTPQWTNIEIDKRSGEIIDVLLKFWNYPE